MGVEEEAMMTAVEGCFLVVIGTVIVDTGIFDVCARKAWFRALLGRCNEAVCDGGLLGSVVTVLRIRSWAAF